MYCPFLIGYWYSLRDALPKSLVAIQTIGVILWRVEGKMEIPATNLFHSHDTASRFTFSLAWRLISQ